MTNTIISLLSVLLGIIGANLMAYVFTKYSLGITGNTIIGVFGSVFFIKSLGRLGFDPISITQDASVNFGLFALNMVVSFIGGAIAVYLVSILRVKMER